MENQISKVVVVGGGFGGLTAVRKLVKIPGIHVTLIDKKNYHLFQPLLYQVAMAGLSPADICYPLRALVGTHENLDLFLGEVKAINKAERWLEIDSGRISFDYLILACGSTNTYFNSPQWEVFAPSLKTIAQATEIRRRVFLAFEKAEREIDQTKKKKYTTFIIVGGGPTGVELAGTLGEITRYTLIRNFHHMNPEHTRIILIEAGPTILPSMTPELSEEAVRELGQLGVEVRVNAKVSDINAQGLMIGNELIESDTILWAAGVGANPLNKTLGVELDPKGRVIVQPDLSIPGHPQIFVIGDQACYKWGPDEIPLPGLAPVAMQQGRFVAKMVRKALLGKRTMERFKYVDKGQMATIGRSRAVAMYKGVNFHGFVAWLAWLLVHIYYLIGFKNRVFVMIQWAWTYLTFRRGARLIIDKD